MVWALFLFCRWLLHLNGAPNTLYAGESFKLRFKFSGKYPFDSPQVIVHMYFLPVQVFLQCSNEIYEEPIHNLVDC